MTSAEINHSDSAEVITYLPASFSRYAPKTALDLVEQLPGFTLKRDNSGQRGFGQAQGNVLIDGQRIASKDSGATAVLGRIPVANVLRLEVFDGASSAIPGLSGQVVNVIVANDRLSGTFNWSPQFDLGEATFLTGGEVSVSGKLGQLDYNLGLVSTGYKFGRNGDERVYDGGGDLTEYRDLFRKDRYTDPRVNALVSYQSRSGSVININAQYLRRFYDGNETYRAFPSPSDTAVLSQRRFSRSERERSGEYGVDYEFALAAGRLKLIALHRYEFSPFNNVSRIADSADAATSLTRSLNIQDESENILRAEYSWATGVSQNWQIAAETALNKLDASTRLERLADDGALVEVPLPNADSGIKEKRAEINISHGRPLSESLHLQLSVGVEQSQISQSSAVGKTRQFTRPKGFASLAWNLDSRWKLNAKVERKVGQLNFFDFVASVNLDENTANAGNPELVPPQTWLMELGATANLGEVGAVDIRVYREFITDIVDQIPIGASGEAPGNIDSADRYGLATSSTLYLDRLGLPGIRVNLEANYLASRVADPLTGASRPISGDELVAIEFELRHDIAGSNYAWGMEVKRDWDAENVRLNQISSRDNRALITLFSERKNLFGMTLRVALQDVPNRGRVASRQFYPQRRTGPLGFREDTLLRNGRSLLISLRGDF